MLEMIQLSKIILMFVAFKANEHFIRTRSRAIFLCFQVSCICKDKEAIKSLRFARLASVNVRWHEWEAIAFLVLHYQISCSMPTNNEICNTANNSTCTATSSHETRIPTFFEELKSFIPSLQNVQVKFGDVWMHALCNVSGHYYAARAKSIADLAKEINRKIDYNKRRAADVKLWRELQQGNPVNL